jgi:hypothetical protein
VHQLGEEVIERHLNLLNTVNAARADDETVIADLLAGEPSAVISADRDRGHIAASRLTEAAHEVL